MSSAKKQSKKDQLIYCGPSLPKGILIQHTVFRGGLPKYLDAPISECPAIRRLLVAPALYDKTAQALKITGSPENIWFREVQTYAQGGAK